MSRIWSFYNVFMYTNITLCPTNSYQLKIKQNSFFKHRTLKTVKTIHIFTNIQAAQWHTDTQHKFYN